MEKQTALKCMEVRQLCLDKIVLLLNKETIPTAATVEMIKNLMEIVSYVEAVCYSWGERTSVKI